MCLVKGSLYDDPFKVSIPLVDYPITYEKFVMDKYIKMKNTLKRYLFSDFPVFIPYFSKRLTLD